MTEFLATGNHPQDVVNVRTFQGKDANRRMLFATFEKSSICVLICHLTPGTVMKRPFVKPSKRKQGSSAEARKLAILEEGIDDDSDDDDDNTTIVDIPISFDGTWSKRGYTVRQPLYWLCDLCSYRKGSRF